MAIGYVAVLLLTELKVSAPSMSRSKAIKVPELCVMFLESDGAFGRQ